MNKSDELTTSEALAKIEALQKNIDDHYKTKPAFNQASASKTHHYGGVRKQYPHRGHPSWRTTRGRAGRYARPPYRNVTLVCNPDNSLSLERPVSGKAGSSQTEPIQKPAEDHKKGEGIETVLRDEADATQLLTRVGQLQKNNDGLEDTAPHTKSVKRLQTHPDPRTTSKVANEVDIQGFKFRVMDGGQKLIRLTGGVNAARLMPPKHTIAGVSFFRSKNGNFYRSDVVKSKKYVKRNHDGFITANFARTAQRSRLCSTFTSTGTCAKGSSCQFTHNPNKVAICKDYLQKGECQNGDYCNLSHDPNPHRVPVCVHFLRDNCTKHQCPYTHVKLDPSAPVCRDFATIGYCEKGAACIERHVIECPDYNRQGKCPNKRCRLPHIDRAAQLRKSHAEHVEESSTIDSDEEFYADDIDSDEDIILNGVSGADAEVTENKDFVHF